MIGISDLIISEEDPNLTNLKLKEQIATDEKIAAWMEYFECPYFEIAILRGFQRVYKEILNQNREIMREQDFCWTATLLTFAGHSKQREKVLIDQIFEHNRLLLRHFTFEFNDLKRAYLANWALLVAMTESLEEQFKDSFKQTIEEYVDQRLKDENI